MQLQTALAQPSATLDAPTDPNSSRADIARLTGDLQEKRQDDRDRARYYRMQEEEDAILAIAAARDYDSDE